MVKKQGLFFSFVLFFLSSPVFPLDPGKEITQYILDSWGIEAGKLDLEVLDFDLRAVLENIADMLALRVQAKSL